MWFTSKDAAVSSQVTLKVAYFIYCTCNKVMNITYDSAKSEANKREVRTYENSQ